MKTLMETHLIRAVRPGFRWKHAGKAAGQFHVYVICHEYVHSREHFEVSEFELLRDGTRTTASLPRVASTRVLKR